MLGIAVPPFTPAQSAGAEGWIPTVVVLVIAAVAAVLAYARARTREGATVHHFPHRERKAA